MKRAHPFPPQMFVELLLRARPRPACQTEARKRQPFRSVAKTAGRGAGRRTSSEREKQRRGGRRMRALRVRAHMGRAGAPTLEAFTLINTP